MNIAKYQHKKPTITSELMLVPRCPDIAISKLNNKDKPYIMNMVGITFPIILTISHHSTKITLLQYNLKPSKMIYLCVVVEKRR